MSVVRYCDKCRKEIAGWNNEYGQVMSIRLNIVSDTNQHNNGVIEGNTEFCSAKCASEYLKSYVKKESEWLDVWASGKILGVAPKKPTKIKRKNY